MSSQSSTDKSGDRFDFRNFTIHQDRCAMKVGIDAVILGAWSSIPDTPTPQVLDIGTGTGILALLIAQRNHNARITAIEIDEAAAVQAQENVANSPYAERITTACLPIQQFTEQASATYDLIICNPPFFSGGVLSEQLERNVARHTVKLSHGDLLSAVRELLADEGHFSLILPKIEAMRFCELASNAGLYLRASLHLQPRAEQPVHRVLQTFGKSKPAKLDKKEMIQYEQDQGYTDDFQKLVGAFYQE
jgi:tRNA1Val (adenine37-N6)-methyltransferase